jgi:hypothetical protein
MSTRSRKIMFLGSKAQQVHRTENITTTCGLTYGILNISQPYRPPLPVTRIAILYFLSYAVHEYEGIHIMYCNTNQNSSTYPQRADKKIFLLSGTFSFTEFKREVEQHN